MLCDLLTIASINELLLHDDDSTSTANSYQKKKTFNTTSEKWYNFGFGGLVTKFVGLNISLIGLDIFVNIY